MPSYDFSRVIDRTGTDSLKFGKYRNRDVLPLWVADMDFQSPPGVIEALRRRVDQGIFGYPEPPSELADVIRSRLLERYDWQIEAEDIVYLAGVVPALNVCCRAYAGPGDAVLTVSPIYPPFLDAPLNMERDIRVIEARADDTGNWAFPQAGFAAAAQASASLFMLCNPWNPVGRVLTESELLSIGQTCVDNDLVICADEIHCDLVYSGHVHRPIAAMDEAFASRTVTLMAASKTFNLAGFGGSFAIIQNPELRERFERAKKGILPGINIMAYESLLAAYRDGDSWQAELVSYLEANRDYLASAFAGLPQIHMNRVEGTYLAWLDVSELALEDAPAWFEAGGLGMSEGERYGNSQYMRLNFGCPRSTLEEAIRRFERLLSKTT